MSTRTQVAGICGIFCGTCPAYPEKCHGCLSDKLAPHCKTCFNGFRQCAKKHGVTWCFECDKFPCPRLEDFLDAHTENGISHHANIIDNLKRMEKISVEAWVKEEFAKAKCQYCGKIKAWNEINCRCR